MKPMERLHQWDLYFRVAMAGNLAAPGLTSDPVDATQRAAKMADVMLAEYEKRIADARAHLAA